MMFKSKRSLRNQGTMPIQEDHTYINYNTHNISLNKIS